MTLQHDSRLELPSHVVFSAIDADEGCLLDSESQAFYSVNGAGLVIVEGIHRGLSFGELVTELVTAFAAPRSRCERDALTFIDELLARNLVALKTPWCR